MKTVPTETDASEGRAPSRADGTPRLVLLPAEGRARGFKNALAFRRWCRRHGVAVHNDRRLQWVDRAEVDAALALVVARGRAANEREAPPSQDAARPPVDPVALAADAVMLARRRP